LGCDGGIVPEARCQRTAGICCGRDGLMFVTEEGLR
jgi:hypothetical protein